MRVYGESAVSERRGQGARGRSRARASGAVVLLTAALVVGSTVAPAAAEPLLRGQSATYDIALVDPVGAEDEFTVVFDAEVAADGSSVVVGQFGGADLQVGSGAAAVILEPFDPGTEFLPSGFVARFDAATQVVWAARFPGAATGVAIDSDGSIGVTGSFSGTATFGDTELTANGDADAFLARYQSDGSLDWVVQAGGGTAGFLPFGCQSPRDIGLSVTFGPDGSLVMGGGITGTAVFTAAEGADETVTAAANNVNGFVARYSAAGAITRIVSVESADDSLINAVAGAPGGGVAVTGFVRGTGTIGGTSLTAAGGTDAFVALLGTDGSATWLAQVGGSEAARPVSPVCGPNTFTDADWPTDNGVGIDISGDAVVALTEAVGTTTLANPAGDPVVLEGAPAADRDLVVARYSLASGALAWASRATSDQEMLGGAVLASTDGGAVATGYFRSAAAFGEFALTGSGDTTMFVVGFDAEGVPVWADAVDSSADGFSVGFGLAQAGADEVFAVGKTTFSPERTIRVQYITASAAASGPAATLSLACEPLAPAVGAVVTCTVTGGEAGVEILWRAAYNPAFAGEGVTLDGSGSGTFTFRVPAAALGEELTVELVDWLAPVSLGVVGGPVPTSVPSGEGPVPVWSLVMLVLAGGLVLRRMSVVGVRG
jgi:hypothetical protein